MIVFSELWVFLLLPLPYLVAYLSIAYKTKRDALRVPFFKRLVLISGYKPADGALILQRNRYQKTAIVLTWILLITALANPKWLGDPIVKQQPARDIMLAVDISASMESEDFVDAGGLSISRLSGVKSVLKQFISKREFDRIGLIVFGSAPYLQAPFTLDHDLLLLLLDEVRVGMAGPKTMLGDAIGLSVKHFSSAPDREKVLILLTDGNDTGSLVPPVEAARVAKDLNIVIHTIAIGDPKATGQNILDAESLRGVAKDTSGVFFLANGGGDLEAVYERIDALVGDEVSVISHRPESPLYHWPLGLMVVIQLLLQIMMAYKSRRTLNNSPENTVSDISSSSLGELKQ